MLQSIIPTPLHPAVVHLPVALAILLPLVTIGSLIAIRRGARPIAAWGVTTGVAALLALSAWVSMETGEAQEDRVERVVGEAALGTHEEAAKLFLLVSVAMVGLSAAGLVRGRTGQLARFAGVAGALGVVGAGFNVGHSGGNLVYRHNAASAYATTTGVPAGGEATSGKATSAEAGGEVGGGDDDDDDR